MLQLGMHEVQKTDSVFTSTDAEAEIGIYFYIKYLLRNTNVTEHMPRVQGWPNNTNHKDIQ